MLRRVARLLAVVALAGAAAVGCAGSPAPTDTRPAPLTDEEAFAAAEETYRAYVDAVNARRADEHSTPAPQDFLIGEALEADLETARQLEEIGVRITGVTGMQVRDTKRTDSGVQLSVCLDVSQTAVVDAQGTDVTPSGRPDTQGVIADLEWFGDSILVSRSTSSESACSQ